MSQRNSPNAVEAERALLGVLLQDCDAATEVFDLVRAKDFYRPEHGAMFALIEGMVHEGIAVDTVTVGQRIGPGKQYGGLAYVASLPESAPSTVNGRHYAEIIALTAARRRTFTAASKLAEIALDGNVPLNEAISAFMAQLDEMLPPGRERDGLIGEKIELTKMERETSVVREFPSGIPTLDHITGGLSAGELTIVAGRPSWGKTSLCIGMLIDHGLDRGPCGFVSLEMPRKQIVPRFLAQLSGVPIRAVVHGGYSDADASAIAQAEDALRGAPIHIEQPGGQTIADIARLARRWKRETGLDILAVDYLSLIKRPMAGNNARTHEIIGAMVKDLKRLAVELDVAVVLAVQLNRASVSDKPRKTPKNAEWWMQVPTPQLHHLAESGDIERDADKVLFPVPADVIRDGGLYRDLAAPRGAAVVIVAKNRQGPLGVAKCRWFGSTSSYHPDDQPLRAVSGGPERHYTDTDREES